MSSKSKPRGQGTSPSGPQKSVKQFRHDVARLKSLGLVSQRVDARSQRETRYMKSQVKTFRDVLEGRAKPVKVPRSVAKDYSDAYRRKGNRVVVPVEKGETPFFDKKSGHVVATRKGYEPGQRLRREFMKSGEVSQPLPDGFVYVIPLGNGEQRFDTWEDAVLFMTPYETGPHKYYGALGDWTKYLIIERSEDSEGEFA